MSVKKQFDSLSEIKQVAILGAGVMGKTIAFLFADKGFSVLLIDIDKKALNSCVKWAKKIWEKQKISPDELENKINRISLSTHFNNLTQTDLVIEALPENQQLKQNIIKEVSNQLSSKGLFASNSSSLSISELSKSCPYPHHFLGLHFFNPAHKMPLVEVILTKEQKTFLLEPINKIMQKLGKTALLVKDSPGFVVNRILASYLTESLLLFEEGCKIENIDHCYKKYLNMPLGPFQLMDKIGLDICIAFISQLNKTKVNFKVPTWTTKLPQVLGLGQKSKSGFYIYNNKNFFLNDKIKQLKRKTNSSSISNDIIVKRGLHRMMDEGKKILEEQIVKTEKEIHLAMKLGIGFSPKQIMKKQTFNLY